MTVQDYIERIRTAESHEAAWQVRSEAYAAAVAHRLTVDEWNDVAIAFNRRARGEPVTDSSDYWRGGPRADGSWTGD